MLAASNGKRQRLFVGLVSVRPSVCLSVLSTAARLLMGICWHQKAAAVSVLPCDPRDEDRHRLVNSLVAIG